MALFDDLAKQAEGMAGKFGIPPEQVQAIVAAVQAKIAAGASPMDAVKAVALEKGLPVEKLNELVAHGGGAGGMMGSLSGLAGGMFKS